MNGSETLATCGAFFNPAIRAPTSDLLAAGVGIRTPGASKTTRAVASAAEARRNSFSIATMVAVVGLTESSHADLMARLDRLGTNLR